MDPYEELLARREQLEAEIMAMRATRRPDVIAQIGHLVQEYDISMAEVEEWLSRQAEGGDRRRGRVAPRYLDPQTGATWSGRGKKPRWMGARDPEEFLIRPSAPAAPDELTRALYGTAGQVPALSQAFQPSIASTIRRTK